MTDLGFFNGYIPQVCVKKNVRFGPSTQNGLLLPNVKRMEFLSAPPLDGLNTVNGVFTVLFSTPEIPVKSLSLGAPAPKITAIFLLGKTSTKTQRGVGPTQLPPVGIALPRLNLGNSFAEPETPVRCRGKISMEYPTSTHLAACVDG